MMNTRTLPLFVGSLLLSAAVIFSYEAVRVESFWQRLEGSPVAAVYLALASVVGAAVVVFIVALVREIRRAQRPEMSDYRQAVKTGRISGDVSQWPDWVRHDRKVNVFRGLGVAAFVCLGVMAIVDGPWWQGVVFFPAALLNGFEAWRTHRRLNALRESLSASTT